MENEYQILNHLDKNQETSQRKISKRTGLSLGTVNLLLKKMVRKGFIKVEKMNAKTLRYIITPQGMAEKTMLAYKYLIISYQQFTKISQALEQIVLTYQNQQGSFREIVFCGPQDEILEMLKIAAGNLEFKYKIISGAEEFNNSTEPGEGNSIGEEKPLVVTWSHEEYSKLTANAEKENILNYI